MKIYIVLTYTGMLLSKIIKTYTKDEFSHVSISLDEELKQMYSFGRLNPYNPFIGGFVHEGINTGTFRRFIKTKTEIYSLEVNEDQYNSIEKIIRDIETCENPYKFNIIGLFAVSIKKKIKTEHSFYCAEFVKYVLENSGIKTNLPEIIRPENFKTLENIKLEYKGRLIGYKVSRNRKNFLKANLNGV